MGRGRATSPRIPSWVRIVVTVPILDVAVWFFLTSQFDDAKASFVALENLSSWLMFAAERIPVSQAFSAATVEVGPPTLP